METTPKPAAAATAQAKAPYRKPGLQVYGSVGRLTMGTGGSKADSGNKTKATSDRETKQHIVRVGEHPLGFGLYLFEYKPQFRARWGEGRRFGVMADEVEAIVPEALSRGDDGYRVVDYALLGVHPAPR